MEKKTLLYKLRTIKKTSEKFTKGEHEVRIRISQQKEKDFIPLGYSSSIEDWDEEKCLPKPSHPHFLDLSNKIKKYLDDIAFELKLAEKAGRYISCLEVKRKVYGTSDIIIIQSSQLKILELFDKVISELEEDENPGYADVFDACRSTVSKLLNNNQYIPKEERDKEKDKAFSNFTKEDHQKYERLISKGTSESTISHYLRTYYRIWNIAIKEEYCLKKEHPSNFIKFKAYKRIKTKKRSINRDYLTEIMNLEFAPDTRKFRSQLFLKFMYYARGINFGDMCKLKNENIANGTIHYTRSKNHREYDYILHPTALEIIEYFKNYPKQSDAGYIFPILLSIHDTARKIDQRIESALKDLNEDLKEMAETVGWERKFTSYSLRHGFATHLRNSGVDVVFIKEALGHETEMQTTVYLDELDDKTVAEHINKALDFKNKKSKKNKKKGRRL